jgi:cytidylate kinase
MKRIITISREFGAGGGEIGRRVAEELHYFYYDKSIILKAAKESNIDIESLIKWDERVPYNFGFAQSLFDFYNRPLTERLFEVQKKVIMKMGEKGHCVIVGRNANTILKEFDSCLHVFVHANPHWRMKRMKPQFPGVSSEKLSEEIRSIDRTRKKYCTHYTNTEFGVADYYDISLNTSKLGIDACVDTIVNLAKMDD